MVIIKTKDFILRPIRLSDTKRYFEAAHDKESQRNFMSFPKDLKEAKKEIQETLEEVKNKGSKVWTISIKNRYAGQVTLQHQDWDKSSSDGRVHLLVHPDFRGQGIGTKSLDEVIRYAFKNGFKRVFAQCKAINKGVIKINKKLGFKRVKTHIRDGCKKILWVKNK